MDCWDKTRRTLGEALQTAKLSDEAMAFVNGAAGNSPASKTIGGIIEPRTGPASKSNSVPHEPPVTASVSSIGTVSTTFRLPAELSAQLLRVSVERKLKRERPFSQQDILAVALAQWLQRNS